jgi:hypothetical protein
MFTVMKANGGERRGQEYGGTNYGERTLRDVMTYMFADESETQDDIEWIRVTVSGDIVRRLPISEEAKAKVLERLEYFDADAPARDVPLRLVDYVLDLPGSATAFLSDMDGANGCSFIIHTEKRIFGTVTAEGRRKVVSVPRHPEKD